MRRSRRWQWWLARGTYGGVLEGSSTDDGGGGYVPHDDTQPNCRLVHLTGFLGLTVASGEEGAAAPVYNCLVFFVVGTIRDAAVCVTCD